MSMSLAALPTELVSFIVADIESKSTLSNLARCSHQLYFCTMPYLYRHVTIREEIRQGEQQVVRLKNLASVLIRRPDLAGHVRHFSLHVARPPVTKEEYSEELKEPVKSDDRVFTTAVHGSSVSEEKKISWLEQFGHTHKSHHDLILALLLPALLKVETLVLDLEMSCKTHYLEDTIRRAGYRERPFDIQPPFQALTDFVHSDNLYNARNRGFIASLLKLPAIQKISGGFGSTWDDDDWGPLGIEIRDTDKNLIELDSSSSSLTSLDLEAYLLSIADLNHILRAPKALNKLLYRVCPPHYSRFEDLRHALRPQENCLESLGLHCRKNFFGNTHFYGPMPSFISFNTLRVFKTAAVFLATTDNGTERDNLIDVFPPSLETLHLTRFEARFESILEALEHLLAQKSPQQTPLLTKLILEQTSSIDPSFSGRSNIRAVNLKDALLLWRDAQDTAIGRLSKVAAVQGVSVNIIGESTEDGLAEGV
ncbi:hypothetical protein MMC22_009692 [Lobaria immixta]|nr:hypothetical protein [Lobaria immixta]